MRLGTKSVAAVLVSLAMLQASTLAEVAPALGLVLQAERARLGGGAATGGATLYDGDRLATDARGTVRVRLGTGQLYLMAESVAAVHRAGVGVRASLERGTAIFAMTAPQGFELEALAARLRAHAATSTLGQVTLTGANEFVVTCNRGALDVIIGDEVRTVTAESSYRVVLEPPEPQGPQGASTEPPQTKAGGKRRVLAMWIPIVAIAGVTTYLVLRTLRSVSDP